MTKIFSRLKFSNPLFSIVIIGEWLKFWPTKNYTDYFFIDKVCRNEHGYARPQLTQSMHVMRHHEREQGRWYSIYEDRFKLWINHHTRSNETNDSPPGRYQVIDQILIPTTVTWPIESKTQRPNRRSPTPTVVLCGPDKLSERPSMQLVYHALHRVRRHHREPPCTKII